MNDHRIHQVDEYLDGLLSEADGAQIEQHLRLCESCRVAFNRMRQLREQIAALPRSIKPGRDLWPEVEERLTGLNLASVGPASVQGKRQPITSRTGFGRMFRVLAATAAVFILAAAGAWWYFLQPASGWNVAIREGRAWLGSQEISGESRITVGETLRTSEQGKVLIEVGLIGQVHVEPNTHIRLVEASLTDHRLALEKGTISARIFAPPRLFFVETPSALAVDLGCVYTLSVDESGAGLLRVSSGWVALEYNGRSSIVPAGAMCKTRPGFGPGTPYQEDASARLVDALEQVDFGNGGSQTLGSILDESRNMDSITLWHLFLRTGGADRAAVYDRLATLVPPPRGVTRDGMLMGDSDMMQRWKRQLNLADDVNAVMVP